MFSSPSDASSTPDVSEWTQLWELRVDVDPAPAAVDFQLLDMPIVLVAEDNDDRHIRRILHPSSGAVVDHRLPSLFEEDVEAPSPASPLSPSSSAASPPSISDFFILDSSHGGATVAPDTTAAAAADAATVGAAAAPRPTPIPGGRLVESPFYCRACGVHNACENAFRRHCNTRRHKDNMMLRMRRFYCPHCHRGFRLPKLWKSHLASKRHANRVNGVVTEQGIVECTLCKRHMYRQNLRRHHARRHGQQ
jgi:hypothetical protein